MNRSRQSRNLSPPKFATLNGIPISVSSRGHVDHANDIPALSRSPQLISLGESPPTQPSSCESANFGWTIQEQKHIPNGHPPSLSPPTADAPRRPLGYSTANNDSQAKEEHPALRSAYSTRQSSMHSHVSQNARFRGQAPSPQKPQLPHFDQPHFYGAPDVDLLLSPKRPGLVPGEKGLFCGFDALPGPLGSNPAENVIISGFEGGLSIHMVSKRGLNKILTLEGLRGGVFYTKVLPWMGCGAYHQYPLIALVVHGPACSEAPGEDSSMPSSELRLSSDESPHSSPRVPGRATLDTNVNTTQYYQTTVEVYSLSSKKRISTLLKIPETRTSTPRVGAYFNPPPPSGSLSLHADDGNIVVSSGTTGETWIFRCNAKASFVSFTCISKVWTTYQDASMTESKNGDLEWQGREAAPTRHATNFSILSLRGRYLAYCPPNPSSQKSLRARIPDISSTARIPGLNAFAPPQLPLVTCSLDTPGGESMFKGMAKTAMQELSKGAAYAGEMGLQYWNNYWNKSTSQANPTSPYHYQTGTTYPFPPTHGANSPTLPSNKDPGVVSILDLDVLARQTSNTTASPHPVATFKVPQGCSFISLSPNGLNLFTASTKGDSQVIWNLMRMQYAKSSRLKPAITSSTVFGPHIRQVAHFSRMTVTRIVDVVWLSPCGERAAMVTEPGTVHMLEISASTFTWPPPRRKFPVAKPQEDQGETPSDSLTISGAVSSIWNTAKPFVRAAHRRRSSVGISGVTAAGVKAQAGHGTQVLVAGFSKSVGAATGKMNEIRKSSKTRLSVPRNQSTSTIPRSGCIRLIEGRNNDLVFVLGSGLVGVHTIKGRNSERPTEKAKASRRAKYVEFKLPLLPEYKSSPEYLHDLDQDDFDLQEQEHRDPHRDLKKTRLMNSRAQGAESSIPQAEIESNAPYQPFHTDRRVGLHVYSPTSIEEVDPPSPSVSALFSAPVLGAADPVSSTNKAWVFGGPIPSTKLHVGPPLNPEEDEELSSDHRALPSSAIERILNVADGDETSEQIVVTTRRRTGATRLGTEASGVEADEEGFFEDDCQVLDFASQRV